MTPSGCTAAYSSASKLASSILTFGAPNIGIIGKKFCTIQRFGTPLKPNSMPAKQIIDPALFGVSFSLKQCRGFDIDPDKALRWLIKDAGFRRFRLMSYWDEHEKQPGKFNFARLDRQISAIEKAGGVISLCLGAASPGGRKITGPTGHGHCQQNSALRPL